MFIILCTSFLISAIARGALRLNWVRWASLWMLMVVSMATSEGPYLFSFFTIATNYYYIKYWIIYAFTWLCLFTCTPLRLCSLACTLLRLCSLTFTPLRLCSLTFTPLRLCWVCQSYGLHIVLISPADSVHNFECLFGIFYINAIRSK